MPKGVYTRKPGPSPVERFMASFKVDGETGCWMWLRSKNKKNGYGQFGIARKILRAHRVSYEFYCGPIPEGMHVLHRCDRPTCVNPEHLYLGTHDDNMADKVAKGRQSRGTQVGVRGRAHWNNKLTAEDIRAIRAAQGTGTELAKRYGVSHGHIYKIRARQIWAHLP